MSESTHKADGVSLPARVVHFRKPGLRDYLCESPAGLVTEFAPGVTCKKCLEWLHA
jgi:hypothetical protein